MHVLPLSSFLGARPLPPPPLLVTGPLKMNFLQLPLNYRCAGRGEHGDGGDRVRCADPQGRHQVRCRLCHSPQQAQGGPGTYSLRCVS